MLIVDATIQFYFFIIFLFRNILLYFIWKLSIFQRKCDLLFTLVCIEILFEWKVLCDRKKKCREKLVKFFFLVTIRDGHGAGLERVWPDSNPFFFYGSRPGSGPLGSKIFRPRPRPYRSDGSGVLNGSYTKPL